MNFCAQTAIVIYEVPVGKVATIKTIAVGAYAVSTVGFVYITNNDGTTEYWRKAVVSGDYDVNLKLPAGTKTWGITDAFYTYHLVSGWLEDA